MSAEILQFSVAILSSRGLLARAILPNNAVAVKADIDSIQFSVKKRGSSAPAETGTLNVAEMMLDAPAPWSKDKKGYTFLWPAPGTLWPDEAQYRITITLVIKTPYPAYPAIAGKAFTFTYQANTFDPEA